MEPTAVEAAEPAEPAAVTVEPVALAAEAGGPDPYVTFTLSQQHFAFPMAVVREIIRAPEVVRVPLSPLLLEGLANLRGQLLPVVSLRRVLGLGATPHDAATRVVVVEEGDGSPLGLLVDRVLQVVSPLEEEILPAAALTRGLGAGGGEGVDTALLSGIIKSKPGKPMTMILDLGQALRGAEMESRRGVERGEQGEAGRGERRAVRRRERHLVSFQVAEQEYAFPIQFVKEIVQVPAELSPVPRAPRHLLGIMPLRRDLLPLMSLRLLFGLPPKPLAETDRVVVLSLPEAAGARGCAVGMVMDAVSEVLRVPEDQVEALPAYLKQQEHGELSALCRLADGQRLLGILAVEQILKDSAVLEALRAAELSIEAAAAARPTEQERAMGEAAPPEAEAQEAQQLVVLRLDGQEYGVPIEAVQEIIRIPEVVTAVPGGPGALQGMVNVRGQVLPVVSLRARFHLQRLPRDDRQRIIVFCHGGSLTGFEVDAVSEVLKLPHGALEELPARSGQNPLIGRVANLQERRRMILILDVARLLLHEDLMTVPELAGGERPELWT